MKDLDVKMLSELVKNSRRSDRELAKAIGTSQPTATRTRNKVEKEFYIKEYTAIPNLKKLGYHIMAITLIKLDYKALKTNQIFKFMKTNIETIQQTTQAIVLSVNQGKGLGYDIAIISLHPTFATFDKFQLHLKQQMSAYATNFDSFLINNEDEKNQSPITFTQLVSLIVSEDLNAK